MVAYDPDPRIYYYHTSHLGTPVLLIDSTGQVAWRATHSPFGKTQILVSTVENNLRFPGQYYDEETGLHYNWHRYYDPETGRYLTPDPIGLAGGINPFVYAGNNSINATDPMGLLCYKYDAYGIPQPCDSESPPVYDYPTAPEINVSYTQLPDGNFVRSDILPPKPVPSNPVLQNPSQKPYSDCVRDCIIRKLPNIGYGHILGALGQIALIESGAGAVGVAAWQALSNTSTAMDIYNAYQDCTKNDCKCESETQ